MLPEGLAVPSAVLMDSDHTRDCPYRALLYMNTVVGPPKKGLILVFVFFALPQLMDSNWDALHVYTSLPFPHPLSYEKAPCSIAGMLLLVVGRRFGLKLV